MDIHTLLAAASVNMAGLADYLDRLDAAARIRAVRSLRRPEQAKLYEAAAESRPIDLAQLVPVGTPPLREVIHYGRNSLAMLHDFEKRFCLPERGSDEVWGYNEHAIRGLIGPGYFVARQTSPYEVTIDYANLPPAKPATWPAIKPNSARLGRLVYDGTRDVLRAVSEHVTIGRDTRDGQPLDIWFALCRAHA
jgi:hypothetical protein